MKTLKILLLITGGLFVYGNQEKRCAKKVHVGSGVKTQITCDSRSVDFL
jgi:hypothetical protein